MHSAHRGVVSSNYFPPRKPNSHMMSRSGNFTQRLNLSNGSFEIDARLSYNKFLSLVENKTNSHKKMIIQDLKLFSVKFSQNVQKQSTEKKEKK